MTIFEPATQNESGDMVVVTPPETFASLELPPLFLVWCRVEVFARPNAEEELFIAYINETATPKTLDELRKPDLVKLKKTLRHRFHAHDCGRTKPEIISLLQSFATKGWDRKRETALNEHVKRCIQVLGYDPASVYAKVPLLAAYVNEENGEENPAATAEASPPAALRGAVAALTSATVAPSSSSTPPAEVDARFESTPPMPSRAQERSEVQDAAGLPSQPSGSSVSFMSDESKTRLLDCCQQAFDWSRPQCERVFEGYAQFMGLKKILKDWNATELAPSPLVCAMWHQHMLDTGGYAAFCGEFAGQMVHHDPCGDLDQAARDRRIQNTKISLRARYGGDVLVDTEVWDFTVAVASNERGDAHRRRDRSRRNGPNDNGGIMIGVRDERGTETWFRISSHTKMQRLFGAMALQHGLALKSIRFMQGGEIIDGSRTSSNLGLGDGDVIDCVSVQVGGS